VVYLDGKTVPQLVNGSPVIDTPTPQLALDRAVRA
jgi:hypothetical protein